jgi:hypothetical protein
MKNIVAFLLAWAIAINIAVPALSSVDRSRIEALACRPLGVAVTEIVGSHALDGDSRKATAAVVKCAPHVRSEGVEAGLRAYCKRDGGVWACEEDDAYLRRLVAGKGPFEIAARGLTFDEAQAQERIPMFARAAASAVCERSRTPTSRGHLELWPGVTQRSTDWMNSVNSTFLPRMRSALTGR